MITKQYNTTTHLSATLKNVVGSLCLVGLLLLLVTCTSRTSTPKGAEACTPLIILDTDIGACIDDLFALKMLFDYRKQNKCRLLGVVVDREGEDCAACVDVMNNYFGYPDTPIGLERNGIQQPAVFIDYRDLSRYADANGNLLFSCSIDDYSVLPDGWELYRKLLSEQPDHSVSVCAIGFPTSLAHLLKSEPDEWSALTGVELVRQKVKCLYMMAGHFASTNQVEYNLSQGKMFADTLLHLWPDDVDIVFSPAEVGNEVRYDRQLVLNDIGQTDKHPIKQVFLRAPRVPNPRMWDPMVIINAVEGDDEFTISERGRVALTPECVTVFTADVNGNCRYQRPGSKRWAKQMLQKIRGCNNL